MTQHIPHANDANTSSVNKGHVKPSRTVLTYKQSRVIWPTVLGIVAFLATDNSFIAFMAYAIWGLIYDLLTFKIDKLKDSEWISSEQLHKERITAQQYDDLNSYLVKIRQVAFSLSVSTTAFCFLYFPDTNWQAVCFITYAAATWIPITISILDEKVVYPEKESHAIPQSDPFFLKAVINYDRNQEPYMRDPNDPRSPYYSPSRHLHYQGNLTEIQNTHAHNN